MPDSMITLPDMGDRRRSLRAASRARQLLIDHFGVDVKETALRGVHWVEGGRAYFELDLPSLEGANQALGNLQIDGTPVQGISVNAAADQKGDPCLSCGNIAGADTPPVCPCCNFQEIS